MGKTSPEEAKSLAIAVLHHAQKIECKDYRAPPCIETALKEKQLPKFSVSLSNRLKQQLVFFELFETRKYPLRGYFLAPPGW